MLLIFKKSNGFAVRKNHKNYFTKGKFLQHSKLLALYHFNFIQNEGKNFVIA